MMTTRIDYTALAAKLNYSALEKKLEQLREVAPPKKRKQVGDVLAPVSEKLRELRGKGWSYEQLAKELTDAGLPVKPSALRDHLGTKPRRGRKRSAAVARV